MKIANFSTIPEHSVSSPRGNYRLQRKSISEALGGIKDVGTWGGGHPFDVEQVRIAPGAANFPYHVHAALWEMYLFLSGTGEVRGPDSTAAVTAGDSIIFKPGEAHQIRNTGESDLIYYVIADHARADVIKYPDTPGKWAVKPDPKCFIMTEVSYYEPED